MAESPLSGAQILGGIAVEITGNIGPLRQKVAEAKAVASQADRELRIRVPMIADGSHLRAQAAQFVTAASAGLAIRIPVMLDTSMMAGQLASMRGQLGGGAMPLLGGSGGMPLLGGHAGSVMPTSFINIPSRGPMLLPAPGQATVGGSGATFGNVSGSHAAGMGAAEFGYVSRGMHPARARAMADPATPPEMKTYISRMEGGPNSYVISGNRAGAAAAASGRSTIETWKLIGRAVKIAAVAEGVVSTVGAGNDFVGAFKAGRIGDVDEVGRRIEAGRDHIRSLPFGSGNIIDKVGNTIGNLGNDFSSAWENAAAGRGFKSDRSIAKETTEQTKQIDKRNAQLATRATASSARAESSRQLAIGTNLGNQSFGRTGTQIGVMSAQAELDEFNRTAERARQANGNRPDDADTNDARAALQQKVQIARRADAASNQQGGFASARAILGTRAGAMASGLATASMRAGMAGDSDSAFALGRRGERTALAAGLADSERESIAGIAGMRGMGVGDNDPRMLRANAELAEKQKANLAKLAEFDVQTQAQAEDRKRVRAADTIQTIGTIQEAGLRVAQRHYEADLAAFDANARAKLATITDVEEKTNEAARLGAQRRAMVAQQERQIAQNAASAIGAGQVATMRADRDFMGADLQAFDLETKRRLDNADPRERDAIATGRAEEREALDKEQEAHRVNVGASLRTRRFVAGAAGAGNDQLAGVIGTIGGMRAEMRNAPEEFQGDIAATQSAELRSMRDQILRPRQYATEFDSTREAAGGPGGESGKEIVDILKLIHAALTQRGDATNILSTN